MKLPAVLGGGAPVLGVRCSVRAGKGLCGDEGFIELHFGSL